MDLFRNGTETDVRCVCIVLRPRGQGARGPSVPQRAAPSEGGHSKCKWHVARVVRARALRSIGGRRRTGHPWHAPSAAAASSAPTPDPPACWCCERPRGSWLRRWCFSAACYSQILPTVSQLIFTVHYKFLYLFLDVYLWVDIFCSSVRELRIFGYCNFKIFYYWLIHF